MPRENERIGKTFVKVISIGDTKILFFKREIHGDDVKYKLVHHNKIDHHYHGFKHSYKIGHDGVDLSHANIFDQEVEWGDVVVMYTKGVGLNLHEHEIESIIQRHLVGQELTDQDLK